MPNPKNITGQRFGRLVALDFISGNRANPRKWRCQCDCGAIVAVITRDLFNGNTTSCGCRIHEFHADRLRTHGMTRTITYATWTSMLARCSNPQSDRYVYYGGRGITVCERWHSFDLFFQDMGERPSKSHSLDRIDNDGNYEPRNCRWALKATQNRNRRNNVTIEYRGETMCITDWADRLNMDHATLQQRIQRYGWSVEKAFTTPVRPRSLIVIYNGQSRTLKEWSAITGIRDRVLHDRIFVEHWPVSQAFSIPVVTEHERDNLGRFMALELES